MCLLLANCVVCVVVHFSIAGACFYDNDRCLQYFVVVHAKCVEMSVRACSRCVDFFPRTHFFCEFLHALEADGCSAEFGLLFIVLQLYGICDRFGFRVHEFVIIDISKIAAKA